MSIQKEYFGVTEDQQPIYRFVITNLSGASVGIVTMGAALQSLRVPDRNGRLIDIVPGFDSGEAYCHNPCHFGAIIGRCCNRIREAAFELDEKVFHITANSGSNHIHGGSAGFDTKNWVGRAISSNTVELDCFSPDGEEGYPGNLRVKVRYSWDDNNQLSVSFHALSDQKTVFNPTSHAYFNLNGHGVGTILNHRVQLHAPRRLDLDAEFLPTGKILPVAGTEYDLLEERALALGKPDASPKSGGYLLSDVYHRAATVISPHTGIRMDLETTLPFLVFYTGYAVKNKTIGKNGMLYGPYCGLCLETSYPVDAIHHPTFPQFILDANTVWSHTTVYSFSVEHS